MAESVLVRCPVCRREHRYTAPVYPCGCGAPVALPVVGSSTPVQVRHRTWAGSWVSARCPACGKVEEWPQPELGCDCGTVLRVPVQRTRPGSVNGPASGSGPNSVSGPDSGSGSGPGQPPAPAVRPAATPVPRPAFRPVTIRTAQDAKTAAAQYLRWLGFADIRVAERTPASGIDLRGPGIVAHVDPTTSPASLRDIETLWLNGLNDSAVAVSFSLAGYARDARYRADELTLPLFVLDLTGTPKAVNDPADVLIRTTR
ncbi:hypothetical protein OG533_30575 [Streptomyces sp. NBC_01186]|uniref:hypothetical protein n=1 Tax=Streptomyces sp. NBC_01186 TaxID=2903765 RepID=UPI002E0FF015|nr:hypothetical protein OG533_30575 [Streptomyces sp. NBC_01186]